jgi:hypothetical protein
MTRRLAAVVLTPPVWTPPGVDPHDWRLALAEDLLDVFALMVEVEPAAVVGPGRAALRSELGWPGLRWYDTQVPHVTDLSPPWEPTSIRWRSSPPTRPTCPAAHRQAAATADHASRWRSPGHRRSRTDRPRLPAAGPAWCRPRRWRRSRRHRARSAPRAADVAVTAGWHRLRAAATLDRLDPAWRAGKATRLALGRLTKIDPPSGKWWPDGGSEATTSRKVGRSGSEVGEVEVGFAAGERVRVGERLLVGEQVRGGPRARRAPRLPGAR